MKVNVIWQSYNSETPSRGYWDQGLLEHLFDKRIWDPANAHEFVHYEGFNSFDFPPIGAVVVLPARSQAEYINELNRDIAPLSWVIVILTGDEEAVFPADQILHPRKMVYVMTPSFSKHRTVDRFLGDGWPPDAPDLIKAAKKEGDERPLDWSFAGQITHERRQQCATALKSILQDENYQGRLVETQGFTQGLPHDEYYRLMASSKIVLCPSGPETPDTFRFYEALEAGCLPIVDDKTPKDKEKTEYWQKLFATDDLPFPVITDWRKLKGIMVNYIDRFPRVNSRVFAWWQLYKRQLAYNLQEDINYLSMVQPAPATIKDKITVLIPTSPIPSHPSTRIIDETIASVRAQLPLCEILIMIDGVRPEQEERAADYDEYVKKLLWKTNNEWENVAPVLFDSHRHQAGMTRETLAMVKTPLILFVEHDTPICETIEWEGLTETIMKGDANVIRLHHEAKILEEHSYLMIDMEPEIINGVPLVRTAQWSQRPHLASTHFYKEILEKYFAPNARTMIEDVIHSPVGEAFHIRGKNGWNEFKVMIYAPPGDMKRSYHLDGRENDPKYEMVL